MTVLYRKKNRERTSWSSGAGTQMSTSIGPRRMWRGRTSSEMTERRKSSRPLRRLCLGGEILLIFFSVHVQVGFSLLRPRGRVRSDGEAETSYCQAQVSGCDSVAPARVQSRARKTLHTSAHWFVCSVRCKESESPHAVTVYMMEPQTCQYILGVSSAEAEMIQHFNI